MNFDNLNSINLSNAVTSDIINAVFQDIHMFALCTSFLIFSFAIIRNYKEYGNHLGIHFIIFLSICIVCAVGAHHVTDKIMDGMRVKINSVSDTIEGTMVALQQIKFEKVDRVWDLFSAITSATTLFLYAACISLGRIIRTIIYLLINGIYSCVTSLGPIFFALLTIQETRSTAVNYIMHIISFILMPVCFLFGDLAMLWIMDNIWKTLLADGAIAGAGAVKGVIALKAVGVATISSGFFVFAAAFAIAFVVLAIICYGALPLLFVSLFRGGSVGGIGGLIMGAAGGITGGAKAASSAMEGIAGNPSASNGQSNLGAAQAASSAVKNLTSKK